MVYIDHMNKEIKKIYKSLLEEIFSGKIKLNETLPREIDLAARFNTNRMNARRAVNILRSYDIVTRKRRIGTTVNQHLDYGKIEKLLKEINRSIYVLYSMTPHWIHWNETSFAGLEEVVEPEGFSVDYCNIPTGSQRAEYQELLDNISKAGASALVIFPDEEDMEFLDNNADLLLAFKMPVFMLNRSGAPISLDMVSCVSMDPFGDGAKIGMLLANNGYKNILMLNEESGTAFWGKRRFEGLKMGILCGHTASESVIRHILSTEDGVREASEIIAKANGHIAVVAVNNEYAAKIINYCSSKGLTIPDDYQLITFDDNPLYRSYNLTSLGIPMREIGRVFGNMICDNTWLKNHKGKISIKLNSELIIRNTIKLKIT
jgi:DNA-binding LacI/PurR family transcriptional regulator